jgi:hypothetical protein
MTRTLLGAVLSLRQGYPPTPKQKMGAVFLDGRRSLSARSSMCLGKASHTRLRGERRSGNDGKVGKRDESATRS